MENEFWSYVSSKSSYDPVKTIFVCAPAEYSCNSEKLDQFAEMTGWKKMAEEDAALLIMPISYDWKEESDDLLMDIYQKYRNSFRAPSGKSIPGRDGIVWTWETLIYMAGYLDGADFAGRVLVKHPNMFAATALLNGAPDSFENGNLPSDHWLIKNPSSDYCRKNCNIPTTVLFAGKKSFWRQARNYFSITDKCDQTKMETYNGIQILSHFNSAENSQRIEEIETDDIYCTDLTELIFKQLFNHTIRWKNSGDGTLRHILGKEDFYKSDAYRHYIAHTDNADYPYVVYLPAGKSTQEVYGLPLVFSIHGRGEPAWLFAEKNGWQQLADETGEFITVFPDSPENIWTIERDKDAICEIINQMKENYHIDEKRVYLTGFSNGAVYTDQQMTTFPELFAAASPWNGPSMNDCKKMGSSVMGSYYIEPSFLNSEYEMPVWICVGDNDGKAGVDRGEELQIMLKANHCSLDSKEIWNSENHYFIEDGYKEAERIRSEVFSDNSGIVKVGLTVMKNMPHGAIEDESRAAWEFMKHFYRKKGDKKVTLMEE